MDRQGTFEDLTPLSLLEELTTFDANGYLQVFSGQVSWGIYFEAGRIVYASHSVAPFERLDLHLRRLDHKLTEILKETYASVRQALDAKKDQSVKNLDYATICSLLSQKHLNHTQAAELIDELAKEVIETFSWVKEGNYKFFNQRIEIPKLAKLEVKELSDYCKTRLQAWQALGPEIWSPYQRPYFFGQSQSQEKSSPESQNKLSLLQQKLGTLLKGFSFRQLAVLLKQDEIKLAQGLRAYVIEGNILVREPQTPFDQLPRIPEVASAVGQKSARNIIAAPPPSQAEADDATPTKYIVACVDDSPTILNEISRFLDEQTFTVHPISDSLKALMQIVRIKPDIILLDVGMPNLDGYELCRLLRNNSLFKNTPIVMVTGNTGIIDRAKAKMVGATGYLTKPFTQSDLLKTVFKHLA
jgi:twitching motility two-component system response regulator PilG